MTPMTHMAELRRYPESASACLVKSMLEEAGIPATVHRVSRYAGMGGAGYVLRASAGDLPNAQKLLERTDSNVDMDAYVDPDDTSYRRCPECNSIQLTRTPLGMGQWGIVLVTLGIGYLGITKTFQCRKCGASWQAR